MRVITDYFRTYSDYLKAKYGESTYRVGVDGGFSCPNRGNDRRSGGCSFCDEFGSRAAYQRDRKIQEFENLNQRLDSIRQQTISGAAFLQKRYGSTSYILYFQAFSSTFGPVEELKQVYDTGLEVATFRELVVSTRPDCVNKDNAELLGSYVRKNFDVWVELGLQTANNTTLRRIGRGHTAECFDRALGLLRKNGIRVAAHVIFGLPGEGRHDIIETINRLATLRIDGIKIHDLHLPRKSRLFSDYQRGELVIPTIYRHLSYTADALERLPPETIAMRLTCDTPILSRGLPIRTLHKGVFVEKLRAEFDRRGSCQGSHYQASRGTDKLP